MDKNEDTVKHEDEPTSPTASRRKSRKSRKSSMRRKSSRRKSGRRKSSRRKSSRRKSSRSRKSSRKSTRGDRHVLTAEEILVAVKAADDFLESPVDLRRNTFEDVKLMSLHWEHYYANPLFMKMTNTTNSVVLNAAYPSSSTPTLSGGPLDSSYKFAQLHFHWGERDDEGSEHLVEGRSHPLEGHIVMYNSSYESFDKALNATNGILVLVYMFSIHIKTDIAGFTKHLPKLRDPNSQLPLTTLSLNSFLPPFVDDYVVYYGHLTYPCQHGVLWFVNRNTMAVTQPEMEEFRLITSRENVPIGHNFRNCKPFSDRSVFLVNGSGLHKKLVLHPLPAARSPGKRSRRGSVKGNKRRGSRRSSNKSGRRRSRRLSRRSSKRNSRRPKTG